MSVTWVRRIIRENIPYNAAHRAWVLLWANDFAQLGELRFAIKVDSDEEKEKNEFSRVTWQANDLVVSKFITTLRL